ncbi:hypothetical protein L7F22_015796 [Adiantum nelumboides]|nr:hypothetical protein [Adiantum nelumboides]
MGRHGGAAAHLCRAHRVCAGLVHWYASPWWRFGLDADHPQTVAYSLGIYLLNLFLAFLSPKFDPSLEQDEGMEDGDAGTLPTKNDQEFRPFVRRLPEFKFWYSATQAIAIGFVCTWFSIFDIPVFWPVLVLYWIILFVLTMRRQIQHMIKYRYVPFTVGKQRYKAST